MSENPTNSGEQLAEPADIEPSKSKKLVHYCKDSLKFNYIFYIIHILVESGIEIVKPLLRQNKPPGMELLRKLHCHLLFLYM